MNKEELKRLEKMMEKMTEELFKNSEEKTPLFVGVGLEKLK
jgi:hypothetical protein